jgi:hypothetical protein
MITHSDVLEREIADEHEALAENLAVLEGQAKDLVDWRTYVRKSPLTMVGVAFGSGLLISAIAGSPRSHSRTKSVRTYDADGNQEPSAAHEAWEIFKGAVIGAAAQRVTSYVTELLPEFGAHIESQRHEKAESRRKPRPVTAVNADTGIGSEL